LLIANLHVFVSTWLLFISHIIHLRHRFGYGSHASYQCMHKSALHCLLYRSWDGSFKHFSFANGVMLSFLIRRDRIDTTSWILVMLFFFFSSAPERVFPTYPTTIDKFWLGLLQVPPLPCTGLHSYLQQGEMKWSLKIWLFLEDIPSDLSGIFEYSLLLYTKSHCS
jgi:hypothetical protein